MPPLNGIERISLALLGKVFFSDSEDEWVMSDNDDKRQFDKVFASEFTPDDNEYLPTGEVCHLTKKDFDEQSRLKIRN